MVSTFLLLAQALFYAQSQDAFVPGPGEIKVRGVLERTSAHPQQWLLRLEKPIENDGKRTTVLEVVVPSPGPASPLRNGEHVEFTGRLDPKHHPSSIEVVTIRALDAEPSQHK